MLRSRYFSPAFILSLLCHATILVGVSSIHLLSMTLPITSELTVQFASSLSSPPSPSPAIKLSPQGISPQSSKKILEQLNTPLPDTANAPAVQEIPLSAPPTPQNQTSEPQTENLPTTALVTPSSNVSSSDADSLIRNYVLSMSPTIQSQRRYPMVARMRNWQGVVWISVKLKADGTLMESHIKTPSGYDVLDKEAMAMIQRAAPFLPPPASLVGEIIQIPIQFSLQNS